MSPRPSLARLSRRPTPDAWRDDELLTLAEAAALFFPEGLLTASSLRSEHRRGRLAAVEVCGRLLTTPAELRRLVTPVLRPAEPPAGGAADLPTVPATLRRAAAAARRRRGLPPAG